VISPTETITPTATPVITPTILITTSFGVSADAYVSQANPATSYSSNRQLQAVASPLAKQSFISFTVAGLPDDAEVVSATLRLTVVNDSTSGGEVYDMGSSNWDSSVTWNSRPAIAGPLLASIGPVALNQVVEVNMSAAVHGNGSYSFAITSPAANTNTVGYASYESSLIGGQPALVVIARASAASTAPTPIAPMLSATPSQTPAHLLAPLPDEEPPAGS
jgi:hypothetical protein